MTFDKHKAPAASTAGVTAALSVLLTGCARAPSVDILGSFFPGWMIALTLAVFLTFAVRWVLIKVRLQTEVGPLALFYPILLTLLTSVLWLVYFR